MTSRLSLIRHWKGAGIMRETSAFDPSEAVHLRVRWSAAIAGLFVAMSLVGCGKTSPSAPKENTSSPKESTASPKASSLPAAKSPSEVVDAMREEFKSKLKTTRELVEKARKDPTVKPDDLKRLEVMLDELNQIDAGKHPVQIALSEISQSRNNLKQIGLAFHDYHDRSMKLPAAVQLGPNNVPHSWRVALLP